MQIASLAVATAMSIATFPAWAGNTRLSIPVDGLTRQAALEQVVGHSSVTIEWRDQTLAGTNMRGLYSGSTVEVVKELLSGTSYAIIYGEDGESLRRIIVTGKGTGSAPPPLQHAEPKSSSAAPVATASVEQRRADARDRVLERMKATAQAVRERLAELPPGRRLIRTQAVRLAPGPTPGQTGNIPFFRGARTLYAAP